MKGCIQASNCLHQQFEGLCWLFTYVVFIYRSRHRNKVYHHISLHAQFYHSRSISRYRSRNASFNQLFSWYQPATDTSKYEMWSFLDKDRYSVKYWYKDFFSKQRQAFSLLHLMSITTILFTCCWIILWNSEQRQEGKAMPHSFWKTSSISSQRLICQWLIVVGVA